MTTGCLLNRTACKRLMCYDEHIFGCYILSMVSWVTIASIVVYTYIAYILA